MAILAFDTDLSVKHLCVQMEARADSFGERIRVFPVQQNHVSTDFMLQVIWRAQRLHFAFVQDGEAIAALSLFHEVSGDDYGYAFFITKNRKILPEITPGAGIESGGGFVQEED